MFRSILFVFPCGCWRLTFYSPTIFRHTATSMTQYSIYNQTLHHLNPEAEEVSKAAFDEVEKHACVQSLHLSYIQSLSKAEKDEFIANKSLNLSDAFFEDASGEFLKQLDASEAETLPGDMPHHVIIRQQGIRRDKCSPFLRYPRVGSAHQSASVQGWRRQTQPKHGWRQDQQVQWVAFRPP